MDEFITFLDGMTDASKRKEQLLISEQRKDEANIERVRLNIIDVFRCLWNVSVNEYAKENDINEKQRKIADSFFIKAERVPQSWKQSLEQARLHDDTLKILIEETKLQAAKEITDYCRQLFQTHMNWSVCRKED